MSDERRKVIVLGAGGHARVLVNLISLIPGVELVGVADRSSATLGEAVGSAKIVATFDDLPALLKEGVSWIALAIGDNRERFNLAARLKTEGFSIMTVRHPSSFVEADVQVGEGAVLCAGSILCAGVILGPGVIVNTGAIVDHETCVGAYAHVGPGSCLAGRVTVGERTFIGAGSRVIEKVRIGADCLIGAGSVVVGDIPDGVAAYGVPAKVQRHV